jgi:Flp pilus assembly protein TadD
MAGEWKGPGAEAAGAYARGQLLASSGNPSGALVELEHAARLAPNDINIEQAVANTLSRLGRFEDAMGRYEAIVHRSPCYLGALTNLGAVYERFGRVDEAIRSYEAAIACDANYAQAYRNLGATLARKGGLRRALEVLRKAKKLAPGDTELDGAIAELESLTR